jgi:uncharacterized sulfatase
MLASSALALVRSSQPVHAATAKPNLILILADDLGYGDLGCYGQQLIQTPHLDRMASEGIRFTQFYAGSTVCAPSRSVLMTGKHMGHTRVRGNAPRDSIGIQALRKDDRTLAHVFKDAGYATALLGKWGLGEIGSEGHPNAMGFDEFFGYLSQRHAHNYFPSFLIHNSTKFPLRNVAEVEDEEGAGWARLKVDYSHDVIMDRALQWLELNRMKPFFLYLALTLPHANNEATQGTGNGQEVPDYGIYSGKPWPDPDKGQAAMISRLDRDVGRLLVRLKEFGIDDNTLVVFSSDNGPHHEGNNNPNLFRPGGPLRGMKRSLYEGGIRVPLVARWPGRIRAGRISEHVGYFGDLFATVGELTGQKLPAGLDSISFLPELLRGSAKQARHDFLYWEFYEQGGRQAVRFGHYKAIREPMFSGKISLYDLAKDIGETRDIAARHPGLVTKATRMMDGAHVDDPAWRVRGQTAERGVGSNSIRQVFREREKLANHTSPGKISQRN